MLSYGKYILVCHPRFGCNSHNSTWRSAIYYRNKLEKCKTTLIRYINENIEMKEKLPEYELPNFINSEEITPSEFSRIMTNVMKRLLFIA